MQPRCCRYFLFFTLLIQSVVIVWLIHDMLTNSSTSNSNHDNTLLDAKAIFEQKGQLTVRDLQVIEDPNTREELTDSSPGTTEKRDSSSQKNSNTSPSNAPSSSQKTSSPEQPSSSNKSASYWLTESEVVIEKLQRPSRTLSDFESAGNNIMITIRTTRKFHQKRLPYMYDTWLNKVNGSNVFLVTDAEDEEYQERSKTLGTIILTHVHYYYYSWNAYHIYYTLLKLPMFQKNLNNQYLLYLCKIVYILIFH